MNAQPRREQVYVRKQTHEFVTVGPVKSTVKHAGNGPINWVEWQATAMLLRVLAGGSSGPVGRVRAR